MAFSLPCEVRSMLFADQVWCRSRMTSGLSGTDVKRFWMLLALMRFVPYLHDVGLGG